MYYNPLSKELFYDQVELDLRNRQNKCMDYFSMTINFISIALSTYFYTRIILFLKFHEKNVFSKITASHGAALAKVNDRIGPVGAEVSERSRFSIADESGDVVRNEACSNSSIIAIPVSMSKSLNKASRSIESQDCLVIQKMAVFIVDKDITKQANGGRCNSI